MTIRVVFRPGRAAVTTSARARLADLAARAGRWLEEPCGGEGRCTGCRVRFVHGAPAPRPAERALLAAAELDDGWRLACQATVEEDATVELPPAAEAGAKSFGPDEIDELAGGGTGQAIAADLGSTTIAAALVDRATTRVLRCASVANAQVRHGEDVIARVARAERERVVLEDALIASLCEAVGALGPHDAGEAVVCGNPIVTHFLLREDTRGLGVAPFAHAFGGAAECVLPELHGLRVRALPAIGGHVGGDAVAAALACGLDRVERPAALIDFGTNCEVVLATPAGVLAASAAAGPAFEGGGIAQGVRAGAGAIDRVRHGADGALIVHAIDDRAPRGVCGTGLVDAVAALLGAGVVTASGRMRARGEVGAAGGDRIADGENGDHAFALAPGVALRARDVRALQLAKASIAVALELLLRRAGIDPGALDRVFLAGSFGARLSIRSLRRIGLLAGVAPARVRLAGDAAACGARMAACSARAWRRALALADRAEHVDLLDERDYADRFAAAMAFPPAQGGRGS